MNKVEIYFDTLRENNLSINEYLALYNVVCGNCVAEFFVAEQSHLDSLEKKGFIKIIGNKTALRESAKDLFKIKEDYFLKWLNSYPIRVRKTTGGSRVLSPASDETIEGKRLRKKWKTMFKGNPKAEEKAIRVLEAEVLMRKKANDLEYMVEAARWLNGGYHEKYEYLLEEKTDVTNGIVDSYEEDWN